MQQPSFKAGADIYIPDMVVVDFGVWVHTVVLSHFCAPTMQAAVIAYYMQ